MINTATEYVPKHGLNFNSNKTSCMIMGGNPFTSLPQWNMVSHFKLLKILYTFLYTLYTLTDLEIYLVLHTVLIETTASTRAFYSLMRAGIKYPELDSNIVVNIFVKYSAECLTVWLSFNICK